MKIRFGGDFYLKFGGIKMSVLKKISEFFNDPFFWNLYEAERSPDSKAMTMLFEGLEK